jgi:hypothetical protein
MAGFTQKTFQTGKPFIHNSGGYEQRSVEKALTELLMSVAVEEL